MMVNHFTAKKNLEVQRQTTENQYEDLRKSGTEIIRATLAEVVDFRNEFAERDAESQKVLDLIDTLSPEQYVQKQSDATRRIKMNA